MVNVRRVSTRDTMIGVDRIVDVVVEKEEDRINKWSKLSWRRGWRWMQTNYSLGHAK